MLIVLFQASSAFGEEISAGIYTDYNEYLEKLPGFVHLI
jgi:hypothetical protein